MNTDCKKQIQEYVEEYYIKISDFNKNFLASYDDFLEKTHLKERYKNDKNDYNWRNNIHPPSRNSIINRVFDANKNVHKRGNINFINELNTLLKSAGYSPLHERNPEDLLIKFCLKNNMSYSEYSDTRKTLGNDFTKNLKNTQYNEELFKYIRSDKSKKGKLSKEEISEFENFIMNDDSKIFSKTRLSVVRHFSYLREIRDSKNLPTYTTRWFKKNAEDKILSGNLEDFNDELQNNYMFLTRSRNSIIKVLADALFTKYIKQGLPNVSINRIAHDFEKFYFSNKSEDLIIRNKKRANKGSSPDYKIDRLLAEILTGKKTLTRTSLIQWLLFCELTICDIDEYLEEAQFFPISGYEEKDALSNMITFLYKLKDEYQIGTSELIKTLYEELTTKKTLISKYNFPLIGVSL